MIRRPTGRLLSNAAGASAAPAPGEQQGGAAATNISSAYLIPNATNATQDDVLDSFGSERFVDEDCLVSNDPPPPDGGIASLQICNITQYQCALPNPNFVKAYLVILYDYDLYYNPLADLDRTIQYLEESTLEHMAASLGKLPCIVAARRRRTLQQQKPRNFTQEEINNSLGISLLPRDTPDGTMGTCTSAIVSSTSPTSNWTIAQAPSPAGQVASKQCIPMKGGMTLTLAVSTADKKKYQDGLSDSIKEEYRRAIRNFMKLSMDNDMYVVPTIIEKVVFVENRPPSLNTLQKPNSGGVDSTSGINSKSSSTDDGSNHNLSPVGMALLGVGSGLIVLLFIVMALVAVHKKRRNSQRTMRQLLDADSSSLASRDSLALKTQSFTQLYPTTPGPDDMDNSIIIEPDDTKSVASTVATADATLTPGRIAASLKDSPSNGSIIKNLDINPNTAPLSIGGGGGKVATSSPRTFRVTGLITGSPTRAAAPQQQQQQLSPSTLNRDLNTTDSMKQLDTIVIQEYIRKNVDVGHADEKNDYERDDNDINNNISSSSSNNNNNNDSYDYDEIIKNDSRFEELDSYIIAETLSSLEQAEEEEETAAVLSALSGSGTVTAAVSRTTTKSSSSDDSDPRSTLQKKGLIMNYYRGRGRSTSTNRTDHDDDIHSISSSTMMSEGRTQMSYRTHSSNNDDSIGSEITPRQALQMT